MRRKPATYQRGYVVNGPTLRVSPELAVEIGLNESIVLLQLEYLIAISGHEHEGRRWTYQSLAELRDKYFPFWHRATIGRTIKSLAEADLIVVGNFNRDPLDKTAWYALGDGASRLTALSVLPMSQSATRASQVAPSATPDATPTSQAATPFKEETTSETTETTEWQPFLIAELGLPSTVVWRVIVDELPAARQDLAGVVITAVEEETLVLGIAWKGGGRWILRHKTEIKRAATRVFGRPLKIRVD